jgi:hypothetical protein
MFTYNIQLAGYPHEKVDEKGQITFNEFTKVFVEFPWMEQLDKYDEIQEGCSATISVKAFDENKSFWVSIAGNRKKHIYLVGFVYIKAKRGMFGLGKEKMVNWLDIYEIENKEEIKALFNHYCPTKVIESGV